MIKVLLERKVKKENYDKLIAMLKDLRAASLRQPGYVIGETLVRGDDPIDTLVISTWISEDHWKAWTTLEKREEINNMISALIEGDTRISIYKIPSEAE